MNKLYNLGGISESYAKNKGAVMHKAWRQHNAALILVEIINPKISKHMEEHISMLSSGITVKQVLSHLVNSSHGMNRAELIDMESRLIDCVLSADSSEKEILGHCESLLAAELKIMGKDPIYYERRYSVNNLHLAIKSIIKFG